MPRLRRATLVSSLWCGGDLLLAIGVPAHAQDAPPAYLSLVEGVVMLERERRKRAGGPRYAVRPGRSAAHRGRARRDPVPGRHRDRNRRILAGRSVTPTRVRLLAGTMDHIQGRTAEAGTRYPRNYLPQDLQTYGNTFDRDGSWQYAAPHGYVWYPAVAPDWRPYYYGSWSAVPSYGWTWIGIDALVVADAPLRPMGLRAQRLVLDSGPHVGRGVGVMGGGGGLRELVPTRVRWPSGHRRVNHRFGAIGIQGPRVERLDRGAARALRRARNYAHRYAVEPRRLPSNTPFVAQSRPPVGLPHQSAVGRTARRQSSVVSRQSSVVSRQSSASVVSRQSSVASRQSQSAVASRAVGSRRQSAVSSRQAAVSRRQSGVRRVGDPSRAVGRGSRRRRGERVPAAVDRDRGRDRPTGERPTSDRPTSDRLSGDRRLTTTRSAVLRSGNGRRPRRHQRLTVPERPHTYPQAVPRGVAPAGVPQPTVPAYRQAEPQRWHPPPSAAPRTTPPPVQRAPVAPPAVGSAPAQAAPSTPQAAPPARSAPSGAAREGTARPRSGGDGQPAGGRRAAIEWLRAEG